MKHLKIFEIFNKYSEILSTTKDILLELSDDGNVIKIFDNSDTQYTISIDFIKGFINYTNELLRLDDYLNSEGCKTTFVIKGHSLITINRYGDHEFRTRKYNTINDLISEISDKKVWTGSRFLPTGLLEGVIKIDELCIIVNEKHNLKN